MAGNPKTWWGTHAWWEAHIHGGLASQPASFGGVPGWGARGAWPGHHVYGLPTMYGFPTMYLASPPCILIKGIRYQESGIRYKVLGSRNNSTMRKASMRKANKHYSLALNIAVFDWHGLWFMHA